MVKIILTGLAGDPIFAQAEMLAYFLERNLPDFHLSVSFKSADHWKEFVESQYKKNGWNTRLARDRTIKPIESLTQMIWYETGELIGNAEDFFRFAKLTYNQDVISTDPELLQQIAAENIANGAYQMVQ